MLNCLLQLYLVFNQSSLHTLLPVVDSINFPEPSLPCDGRQLQPAPGSVICETGTFSHCDQIMPHGSAWYLGSVVYWMRQHLSTPPPLIIGENVRLQVVMLIGRVKPEFGKRSLCTCASWSGASVSCMWWACLSYRCPGIRDLRRGTLAAICQPGHCYSYLLAPLPGTQELQHTFYGLSTFMTWFRDCTSIIYGKHLTREVKSIKIKPVL